MHVLCDVVANGSNGNGDNGGSGGGGDDGSNVVTKTVERVVDVVPDELKAALAALAALSVMLGIGYLLAALRARRLARQRRELLQEVGLLQTALLPPVPDKVGALLTSVAYRPADGPGAGGDFYDVLPLTGPAAASASSSATCRATAAARSPARRSCATRCAPTSRPGSSRAWPCRSRAA